MQKYDAEAEVNAEAAVRPAMTSVGCFWPTDTKRLPTPASQLDNRPGFFYECVDGCFATCTVPTSVDIFLNNLNSIHKQIQSTK